MAATFDIEIVTRTTEFRVRPGDKVALPCEVRTSGDHMSSHYQMTILAKMLLKWGARILQSIRLDLAPDTSTKMFWTKTCSLVSKGKLE